MSQYDEQREHVDAGMSPKAKQVIEQLEALSQEMYRLAHTAPDYMLPEGQLVPEVCFVSLILSSPSRACISHGVGPSNLIYAAIAGLVSQSIKSADDLRLFINTINNHIDPRILDELHRRYTEGD